MLGTQDTLVNRAKTYACVELTFQGGDVIGGGGVGRKQQTP